MNFMFHNMLGLILPIDSYFSRWLKPPTSNEIPCFLYSSDVHVGQSSRPSWPCRIIKLHRRSQVTWNELTGPRGISCHHGVAASPAGWLVPGLYSYIVILHYYLTWCGLSWSIRISITGPNRYKEMTEAFEHVLPPVCIDTCPRWRWRRDQSPCRPWGLYENLWKNTESTALNADEHMFSLI